MTKSTWIFLAATIALGGVGCEKASGEQRDDNRSKPADQMPIPGQQPAADDRAPMATPGADNTRENVRDRNKDELTPGDQSNSSQDLKITQDIRKSLVGDSTLSMDAKNVKVITQNGVVTLKGAVKSADEKASIAGKAKSVAGVQSVDDQLEIETKK